MLSSKGVLCASFGILALGDSFMDLFLSGKVSDSALSEEDICTYGESRRADKLYISGVVVRDADKLIRGKRAGVMLWAMLKYVQKHYGLKQKRQLYAIAVNNLSDKILIKCGFNMIADKVTRSDKCSLYHYELTKSSWERLLILIGDHSSQSKLKF
jgi:hypothetical protein